MKKRIYGRKLSRDRGSREALFRSLLKALLLRGEITTTKAKAKAIQDEMDRLITLAKKQGISERRQVYSMLANDRAATDLLFGEIATQLSERKSGFTKLINLPQRKGDRAKIVKLMWSVEIKSTTTEGKKADEKKSETKSEKVKKELKKNKK